MPIRHWPKRERPREILLERGAAALSDGELLAVLIGSGTPNASALQVARSLICRYGSLTRFYAQDADHRLLPPGIGPARFAKLIAAVELGRRYVQAAPLDRVSVSNSHAVEEFVSAEIRGTSAEAHFCLHLDGQRRVLALEELSRGERVDSAVLITTAVRQILAHNSAFIVLAHRTRLNSPLMQGLHSRIATPLKEALSLIRVQVLSHTIVRDRDCLTLYDVDSMRSYGRRFGSANCEIADIQGAGLFTDKTSASVMGRSRAT